VGACPAPPRPDLAPAIALAIALLSACGASHHAPPQDACALSAAGAPWLAFTSRRTGDYEIWRARADGSCQAQVTHDPAADLLPTWAGESVAFASERGGALRIWTHDLTTGAEAPLATGDLASATAPAYSPDGRRIAFEGRATGATTSDLYLVPAGGGTPVALAPHPADDAGPAWAPDGQTVYFVSARSGQYDVWSVPAAGGAAVQVTTGSRIVGKPAVAADGASILYARTVASGTATEVVGLELGSGLVALLSSQDDSEPAVSPDGARVALRSFRADHADVVVQALDGSAAVFLTDDVASDGSPAFAVGR